MWLSAKTERRCLYIIYSIVYSVRFDILIGIALSLARITVKHASVIESQHQEFTILPATHLPRLSDRMQRLVDSPTDKALAEAGSRRKCRRLNRSDDNLSMAWDEAVMPCLTHAAGKDDLNC